MNGMRSNPSGRYRPICPMCGRRLEANRDALTIVFMGQEYRFCSQQCQEHFARMPERHIVQLAHEPSGCLGYPCPYDGLPR